MTAPEPRFKLDGETPEYGLAELLAANDDDREICDYLRSAEVGSKRDFGGGAIPDITIERVA